MYTNPKNRHLQIFGTLGRGSGRPICCENACPSGDRSVKSQKSTPADFWDFRTGVVTKGVSAHSLHSTRMPSASAQPTQCCLCISDCTSPPYLPTPSFPTCTCNCHRRRRHHQPFLSELRSLCTRRVCRLHADRQRGPSSASQTVQHRSRHLPPSANTHFVCTVVTAAAAAAGSQPRDSDCVARAGCAHIIRLVILSSLHASVVLCLCQSYSNSFTAPFSAKAKVL